MDSPKVAIAVGTFNNCALGFSRIVILMDTHIDSPSYICWCSTVEVAVRIVDHVIEESVGIEIAYTLVSPGYPGALCQSRLTNMSSRE
jgi:hypothetical protein